ncbi:MAG: hypothetical protein JST54_31970 [Deltaproteobacteria bacterium]|nr:hypothetical protein [Deltaproteobacteria bacterium]
MSDAAPPAEPAPPSPKPSWRDSQWLRRLPWVILVAVGLLVLLPKAPHDVELAYHLGRAANGLQETEAEVFDSNKSEVQRSLFRGEQARAPVQHLRLPKGSYRVELRLTYPDRVERRQRTFEVEEAERIDLEVETP